MQSQGFDWQRMKDSNPHKQSQSLSCYPYTIPLKAEAIIPTSRRIVNPLGQNFSLPESL